MVNEEILNIETGELQGSLRELKDTIKELRTELDNCKYGSEEFEKTLDDLTKAQDALKNATKKNTDAVEGSYDALTQQMARLKKEWKATADEAQRADLGEQISKINTELKDLDASLGNYQRNVGNYGTAFDGVTMKIEGGVAKFEKFNNVSRSIIGSFDLVEGGLKAIGVESEEVNSLMDSMQGAMMLTNGLQSIKEGVQAFTALRTTVASATVAQKALNAAQMANPIGAVVVAVTALIAGITALVKIIRKNRDEEEQLKEAYEATNKVIEDRISTQELEIQLMEARGEAQADILQKEKEYAELNLNATQDRIRAIETELEQTKTLRLKKKNLLKEQLEDLKDQLKDQEKEVKNANNAILIYETKTKKEQEDKARDAAEEQKRIAKDKADKEIEEAERAQEEINKTYQKAKEERENYWLSELQLKAKRLESWVEEEKDIVRKQHDARLIEEQEYLDQIFAIDLIYADKKKKLDEELAESSIKYFEQTTLAGITASDELTKKEKENAEEREQSEEDLKDSKLNITNQFLSGAVGLLQDLADTQNTNDREGFERSKKLQIAASTISMLQGVVNAVTSAMAPANAWMTIAGQASMAAAMSGMVITSGLLQINKIKKQTFEGGGNTGDSSTGVTMPSINTAGLLSSPVNYTTEVQGAQAETDIPDTRVVVLESDITTTVNKVRVAEEESTY